MAGSKGSKYFDVFLDYEIVLKLRGEPIIDPNHFKLLEKIEETSSITEAAKKCGISYRKAWGDIKMMESKLGFAFINSSRGGAQGGTTILSEEGSRILKSYQELIKEMDPVISGISKKFFSKVND